MTSQEQAYKEQGQQDGFLELNKVNKFTLVKPPGGNYLKVFHLNSYGMDLESTMVGENFRNHLPEIAKNAL